MGTNTTESMDKSNMASECIVEIDVSDEKTQSNSAESVSSFEDFDLDDIEVIESKVFA